MDAYSPTIWHYLKTYYQHRISTCSRKLKVTLLLGKESSYAQEQQYFENAHWHKMNIDVRMGPRVSYPE